MTQNVAEPVGHRWKWHVDTSTEFRYMDGRRGALCSTQSEQCATNGGLWYETDTELSPTMEGGLF